MLQVMACELKIWMFCPDQMEEPWMDSRSGFCAETIWIIITQFKSAPTTHPMICSRKVYRGGRWEYCASRRSLANTWAWALALYVKHVK